jgi:hypothetical protein
VEGEVVQVGEAPLARLVVAQGIPSGAGIETRGPKSLAVFRLGDGSLIELRGDSRIEKIQAGEGERSVTLSRGILAATVTKAPDRQTAVFRSPHGEATAVGSRFVLQVTPEWTRVEVEEGRVRFRRTADPAAIEVAQGFFAQAGKSMALVARPILVTRSFQDGVFPTPEYAGTQDTALASGSPTVNAGSLDQLRVHRQSGNDAQWVALVRWDLSSIPPKSKVLSAEVSFWVTGGAPPPLGRVYEIRRPWKELEATWKVASLGQPWSIQGAQGEEDRGRKILAQINPLHGAMTAVPLNEAGVAVVQQWVMAPQTNCGIVVVKEPSEAWDLASREWASAEHRPKLAVTYVPLGK